MHLINFQITDFNCPACLKLAKLDLEAIKGVKSVKIDNDGRCEVQADQQIPAEEFKKILQKINLKAINI